MNVRLSENADTDLFRIYSYLASRNPRAPLRQSARSLRPCRDFPLSVRGARTLGWAYVGLCRATM